jgi:molybdopterin-guanine dinucleotide biosynthesis protein A
VVTHCLLGILVGGASSRMGGFPKGLLPAPQRADQASSATLVETLAQEFRRVPGASDVVLIGDNAAYRDLGFSMLTDTPTNIGPLGGVRALLLEGQRRAQTTALVACDMPHLSSALFQELLTQEPNANALAWRDGTRWEPMFSRLQPSALLPALDAAVRAQQFSLQSLLDAVGCRALRLLPQQQVLLKDWDTPEDVAMPLQETP